MMRDKRGFSLVELLTVVALVGVASAIAVPNILSQLPKWHANGTTRDIAAKLMMSRLRAIQDNQEYGVLFTLGTVDSFRLVKVDRYDDNSNGNTTEWIDAGASGQSYADINITNNCSINRVNFNPNGTSSSCSIEIRTQDGAIRRQISLSSNTGRISVKFCEKEAC